MIVSAFSHRILPLFGSCLQACGAMGSGASRAACEVGPTGITDVTLNHAVTDKYMRLSQHGKVQAESLRWI